MSHLGFLPRDQTHSEMPPSEAPRSLLCPQKRPLSTWEAEGQQLVGARPQGVQPPPCLCQDRTAARCLPTSQAPWSLPPAHIPTSSCLPRSRENKDRLRVGERLSLRTQHGQGLLPGPRVGVALILGETGLCR